MFRTANDVTGSEQSFIQRLEERLTTAKATLLYLLYWVLVYWPVLLGKRFLWEDFFIQEYPMREYSYYMLGLKGQLPFWNPYTWGWSAFLADAQNGFWYPGNLLQIVLTLILFPGRAHLPVIVPEVVTLLHLPLAALGTYYLCRKEFRTSELAALLGGLAFGFGVRMVAEQNHPMQIHQLALVPWETLLLMRGWRSWKAAVGFGVLFGISFLAGQPQTFFFAAIFFTCFTISECVNRYRRKEQQPFPPAIRLGVGGIISIGVAAIQLLPTFELSRLSARAHMSFLDASTAAIHLGHLINFFVPKFYGQNPGFTVPRDGVTLDIYWYWEAIFYWGILAEILAMFAVVLLWRNRYRSTEIISRHVSFIVYFSVAAIAFGLGRNLGFQWIFWKFIPFFDQFRAPARMIWFVWFLGAICTAHGFDLFRHIDLSQHKGFFYWASGLFLFFHVIGMAGLLDMVFNPHHLVRSGIIPITLPTFILTLCVIAFLTLLVQRKIPRGAVVPIALALIIADSYYCDFTWHRNTLSRETVVAQDSMSPAIQQFAARHRGDHARLLWLQPDSIRKMKANLGIFLRLPIEDAQDTNELRDISPMRLSRIFPPVIDSTRRMELMGVTTRIVDSGTSTELPRALPFLKLYSNWYIEPNRQSVESVYQDSSFDFQRAIVLNEAPPFDRSNASSTGTAVLNQFTESDLTIAVSVGSDQVLLINDLFYPAWRAYVDGKETRILRGFTSLRAVPVTKGKHIVRLVYESSSFKTGYRITLVTLAMACLALILLTRRKRIA